MIQDENQTEAQELQFDLMLDREVLVQVLDNSKEFIEQQVSNKEGQITKAIQNDQKTTEENLTVA